MGALSLFIVLAGGTAYAANTIRSADIVNGEVKTADLANAAVNLLLRLLGLFLPFFFH